MTDAGYVYIGMDHFAKPDDELATRAATGASAPQLPGLFDAFGL
jgi:coproporphyrinogen III oxidase-like Fe-S oxidoreductase